LNAIKLLDHGNPEVALAILAVQMAAYTQEAALLGARDFPPLRQTLADVRASTDSFYGLYVDAALAGVVAVGAGERGGMAINALTVHPDHQRRGIGARLLGDVIARHGDGGLTVQTAVRNTPALGLYRQTGFAQKRRWTVGADALELVELWR